MLPLRRRGFTLIELLVVIAIIAILAAMLFPVFARARESARKIQCLSNVKNIATAFQMYLTDYDRFPPLEHRPEAEDFFSTAPGGGRSAPVDNCNHKQHANPFLRWALVLDEYVRNRDVWRCPSAKLSKFARWIVPEYQPGGWLAYLDATQGSWGRNDPRCSGGPCCVAWPPGWGGSITDSVAQGVNAGEDTGAFELGIGTTQPANSELKTSQIVDPSWHVVCADAGAQEDIWMASLVAYPDACRTGCGPDPPSPGCCSADWSNCSWTADCGIDFRLKPKFFTDPGVGKQFTRHLGGSNIGFADGHAAWMPAGSIVSESPTIYDWNAGHLRGMGCIIDFCG